MNISYEAERAINISNILRLRTKQFTISKKLILLGILNTSYEDEESIFKPITGYSLKEKKNEWNRIVINNINMDLNSSFSEKDLLYGLDTFDDLKKSAEESNLDYFKLSEDENWRENIIYTNNCFLGLASYFSIVEEVANENIHHEIYVYDMIQSLFLGTDTFFSLAEDMGISLESFFDAKILENIQEAKKEQSVDTPAKTEKDDGSKQKIETAKAIFYTEDMNLIGRDDIMDKICYLLIQQTQHIIALVGEHGVGMSSLKYLLAKRLHEDISKCNISIHHKNVIDLDIPLIREMIATNPPVFFDVFKQTKSEISRLNGLLFIDNFSDLVSGDDTSLIQMMYDIFKSWTRKTEDDIPYIIMTITPDDYLEYIECDKYINSMVVKVDVDEMEQDNIDSIIDANVKRLSEIHHSHYSENIIKLSTMLAKKYIKNISSPKNILNILDIAGAYTEVGNDIPEDIVDYDKKIFDLRQSQILFEMVKEKMIDSMPDKKRWNKTMEKKLDKYSKAYEKRVKEYGETIEIKDVTEEAIKESVSELADIPFDKIENNDSEKVKSVISNMKKDIVGQDMAIDMIGKVLKRRSVGIKSNKKPIGVFLFLGQTGVGKTFIAKRLSYYMFGDESNMIRLDMSEYSTPESVNKLIGASAGYVGYNEGGVLTEAVKKSKYCIVLLDEIEKASKEVFNMFLQIFDDGRISDNKGTLVDFSNTLIIMTSNVGARRAAENGLSVGFTKNDNAKQEVVDKELKKTFAPEFLNRIDHIVQFNPLDDNAIYRITKNQLDDLKNTLKDNGIDISYDDDVVKFISAKSIKDKNYTNIDMGARPINRNIQTMVEDLIADYIIENSISVCNLSIYIENNNIKIKSNE